MLQEYSLQSPNGQQPNGDNLDTVHEKQTKIKKTLLFGKAAYTHAHSASYIFKQ